MEEGELADSLKKEVHDSVLDRVAEINKDYRTIREYVYQTQTKERIQEASDC